ncbi:MAG: hypothetical protein KDA69_08920 [Planctomycetaceae bacterium]|nr:hypothetical protein [Planctomycetaceae bacterium]
MSRLSVALLLMLAVLSGCQGGRNEPSAPAPPVSEKSGEGPESVAEEQPESHSPPIDESSELEIPKFEPIVVPVFRPSDTRPEYAPDDYEPRDIRRLSSRRIVLFTDVEESQLVGLGQSVDALYDELVRYFGELPPSREEVEYQLTGYLMKEVDRFRAAEMLPNELPRFEHGRHRGLQFWMFNQEFDYYQRHLVLHEATHCFMTTMPGPLPPHWYMEGMAEYFATHRRVDAETWQFGICPPSREGFRGFGGVDLIRQEVEAERFLSVANVMQLGEREFEQSKTIPYAWSWWMCQFLSRHPRYAERFRSLGQHLSSGDFTPALEAAFETDWETMEIDWALATQSLAYGFDVEQFAFEFEPGQPLAAGTEKTMDVSSSASWQSTGIRVQAGQTISLSCAGRVTLAQVPKPWESEGTGITIRYHEGKPIGRLLGIVLPDQLPADTPLGSIPEFLQIDVGNGTSVTSPTNGSLYLRVNDFWNELADNTGAFNVTVKVE